MEASKKSLERLKNGYQVHLAGNDEVDSAKINELEEKFHQAINDDLNMPLAMGIVWDVIKQENKSFKWAELLAKFDTVLALNRATNRRNKTRNTRGNFGLSRAKKTSKGEQGLGKIG